MLFLHSFTFGQVVSDSDKFYYYYKEKIPVQVNQNKLLVYYLAESEKTTELVNRYNIDKEFILKNDLSNENRKAKIIELLPFMDYRVEIERLELDENVLCVEKIIGDSTPVSNNFYVKLKNLSDISKLVELSNDTGSRIIRQIKSRDKWFVLEVDKYSISDCIDVSNVFAKSAQFESVDPGFIINFSTDCRSDSQFGSQWAINDSGNDINACCAWNITTGSSNVTLAIVDDGIDRNHDEWSSSTFTSFSYDAQDSISPSQLRGTHGTQMAGVIASDHNASDIAGIAPGLKIMDISHGFNNLISPNISEELAGGIFKAVDSGADVINCSWGDNGGTLNYIFSTLLEDAIDEALDNGRNGLGCIVVFSAGNDAPTMSYPATYRDELLAVGAINSNGLKRSSSAYGNKLDLVAPGGGILTTNVPNTYFSSSGTSLATAYVSGVAGLILSENPNFTRAQVVNAIESSTRKLDNYTYQTTSGRPNGTWNNQTGYGLLDAAQALDCQEPTTLPAPPVFINTPSPTQACLDASSTLTSGPVLQPNQSFVWDFGAWAPYFTGYLEPGNSKPQFNLDNSAPSTATIKVRISNCCGEGPQRTGFFSAINCYSSYRISPNPVSNITYVTVIASKNSSIENEENTKIYGIEVIDQYSKKQISKSYNEGLTEAELDFSQLVPGIYTVTIFDGKKWNPYQVVKQ